MILHIVNKTTADGEALTLCLRSLNPGDCVLLIEDAVYAAHAQSESARLLAALEAVDCCVLREDADLRGIAAHLHPRIRIADYPKFVELAVQADKTQSWF